VRRSGLVISALFPGSSIPGSSLGQGYCVLGQDTTLTVPLYTMQYKCVPANCWGNLTNCRGVTCEGLASHPGGIEILLAAPCYRNCNKLRQLGQLTPRLHTLLFYRLTKYSCRPHLHGSGQMFAQTKTCIVPPCVYRDLAELDKFLNG